MITHRKTDSRIICLFSILCGVALVTCLAGAVETEEFLNIAYYEGENPLATSEEAQLNLVIPKGVENPPVLVWIGQGAWAYVNRHVEMNICRRFAENGIVVVSAGHRLSPALLWEPHRETGVRHPEHIKDIAQVIRWLSDHHDAYGFTLDHLFVGGYSSGAHLSALLAMDGRYLEAVGLSPDVLTAIIPVSGGYDIPDYRNSLIEEDPSYDENHILPVFGDHDAQVDASPVTYLEGLSTPMLILSERDTYAYTALFEQKLVESGFEDFQVLNFHNETHSSLWKSLGGETLSPYREYIVNYIWTRSVVSDETP